MRIDIFVEESVGIENMSVALTASIVSPFILFLVSGILIKRHEKCLREFYWVLREKFVYSYIRQNRIVRLLRKCFKMQTEGTIHWLVFVYHFIQIAMAISPIYMILMSLFLSLEETIILCLIIEHGLFGLFWVSIEIFTILQMLRCERIKKKNPEHSTRRLYPWHGNRI